MQAVPANQHRNVRATRPWKQSVGFLKAQQVADESLKEYRVEAVPVVLSEDEKKRRLFNRNW